MIPGQLKMGEYQGKCGALPGGKTAVLKVGKVNINPHICNLSYITVQVHREPSGD